MNDASLIDEQSSSCSVTRASGIKSDAGCEDVIYFDRTATMKFFGLADGQSGKRYCRDGGREVLGAVFRFVAKKGITQMLQYEHADELQYEIIRIVRDTITKLAAAKGAEKTEYASTLLVFAYDTQTGNYLLIHLGDGGIIGQKSDGTIGMLSAPDNGLTTNYTWLTTSQEALFHLRIGFGCVQAYKRILLITDGATLFAHGKNIPETSRKLIGCGSREDIVSSLAESRPADDASCIVIDFV